MYGKELVAVLVLLIVVEASASIVTFWMRNSRQVRRERPSSEMSQSDEKLKITGTQSLPARRLL